jgi:hypothetical protein
MAHQFQPQPCGTHHLGYGPRLSLVDSENHHVVAALTGSQREVQGVELATAQFKVM